MSCQYFIRNKNRYCLNKSEKNKQYCKLHNTIIQKQSSKIQIGGHNKVNENQYVSPYVLISSQQAPNPPQQSWYHYQAPVYQSFGDYICIKKSFLNEARNIVHDIFAGPQK